MEYGHQHAEVYDLVFEGRGKDFEAEARRLTELVRDRHPAAESLLDEARALAARLGPAGVAGIARGGGRRGAEGVAPVGCAIARKQTNQKIIRCINPPVGRSPRTG